MWTVNQHGASACPVMKETCVRQVECFLLRQILETPARPRESPCPHASLPSRSLSALRPGGVRTRLGEVPELLLSSLQHEAELGGSRAALPHVRGPPRVRHDPRGAGLHQW